MAYNIIVFNQAHIDVYEAYEWYEQQRNGLGDEFLTQLEFEYNKISQNPTYFSFIDDRKELRDYLLHRFPFLVVYRIKENVIQIVTVHHSKKNPNKKYTGI